MKIAERIEASTLNPRHWSWRTIALWALMDLLLASRLLIACSVPDNQDEVPERRGPRLVQRVR